MGFWAWLFGKNKKVNVEEYREPIKFKELKTENKPVAVHKPKYKPIPRTKETSEYVKSVLKKAQTKDSEPMPYKGNVDEESVKKFVDKIQGRK